jgi:hypothetical protein
MVADTANPASGITILTMTGLNGSKTRFPIAKMIQEIGSLPASIFDDRKDNNAPARRLEQPRDVMVTDARIGYCCAEIRSHSTCTTPHFGCPCPLPQAQRRYSPKTVRTALRTIQPKRLLQIAVSPTVIAIFHVESPLTFAMSRSIETDVSF